MVVNSHRLLVLDDEPDVAEVVCAVARTAGYECEATNDADAFYGLLAAWSPAVVLLDLMMPGVDGIDVLRRMRTDRVDASVILASGAGARVLAAAERAASENGLHVAGVLRKPFAPADLTRVLAGLEDDRERPCVEADGGSPPEPAITTDLLGAALAAGELRVYLQPKVACASLELAGFEALARWERPGHGLVLPDRFIPVAEDSEVIHPLTDFVSRTAIGWLVEHRRAEQTSISINVSARNLVDESFAHRVQGVCDEYGLEPRRVTLELTETSTLNDPTATLELLTQCRVIGFHVSIDDFGSGYSSLVQLARLPFSELKIDRSFVGDARSSREARAIISATIGLAKALALDVTAEGVEDEWTLRFLADLGCDFAQGFHIARPMPFDAVDRWVAEQTHS